MVVTVYLNDGTKVKYKDVERIERECWYLYVETCKTSAQYFHADIKRLSVRYKFKENRKK